MRIIKKGKYFIASERLKQLCLKSFFGIHKDKTIYLQPEEVLFLAEQKSIPVYINKKRISLARLFEHLKKHIISYYAYRDWRFNAIATAIYKQKGKKRIPTYTSEHYYKLRPFNVEKLGSFYLTDKKYLFSRYWFGQYSAYKAKNSNDKLVKLDPFEAYYLSLKGYISIPKPRIKNFDNLFELYKEWRDAGYVVKTGFKFGANFRVYDKKTKPNIKAHKHSMFVLHFFDKNILSSEWARAIRVAHSVKKSFVFSTNIKPKAIDLRYYLYTRKGHGLKTPAKDSPSFILYPISEDKLIDLSSLIGAVQFAENKGLDLMVAIVDRDTSVTYYRIRRISLEGSKRKYYEVLWFSK